MYILRLFYCLTKMKRIELCTLDSKIFQGGLHLGTFTQFSREEGFLVVRPEREGCLVKTGDYKNQFVPRVRSARKKNDLTIYKREVNRQPVIIVNIELVIYK